jgi:hypothetical protein
MSNASVTGSLVTTASSFLGLLMDKVSRYGIYEHTEEAIADSQQGVVLQIGVGLRAFKSSS